MIEPLSLVSAGATAISWVSNTETVAKSFSKASAAIQNARIQKLTMFLTELGRQSIDDGMDFNEAFFDKMLEGDPVKNVVLQALKSLDDIDDSLVIAELAKLISLYRVEGRQPDIFMRGLISTYKLFNASHIYQLKTIFAQIACIKFDEPNSISILTKDDGTLHYSIVNHMGAVKPSSVETDAKADPFESDLSGSLDDVIFHLLKVNAIAHEGPYIGSGSREMSIAHSNFVLFSRLMSM